MITPQTENIIKAFLASWWESLSLQAQQTVLGAELPFRTSAELYDNPLGWELQQIAELVDNPHAVWDQDQAIEALDIVQKIAEYLYARPSDTYVIPNEFWSTPIGYLCLRAHIWARRDELITLTQASELTGKSPSALSQIIRRKNLTLWRDPFEPNPQRSTRLLKSELANIT